MFRTLIAASLLSIVTLPALADSKATGQKNVVLIVADDLGFMLGCYGDADAKTPNLDQLAREGTRFTRAHCTTSSCSASRSVMLTGLYNHANAHYGHEHGYNHFRTYDTVRSLPVMLAEAGYRTCSIGKYHLAPEAVYHFESYGNEGVSQAPALGKGEGPMQMADSAQRFMAKADPRPFFLYFCTHEPHRAGKGFNNEQPMAGVTPVKYDPAQVKLPNWLPDQPDVRKEWAEYLQAISRMDQAIGGVMKGLEETGHKDDTLVLFISDNGPPFPGAKTTLYEPGTNLPLIVRNPAISTRGITSDAMVTWADLTPTILDYAGVKPAAEKKAKPAKPRNPPGTASIQGRSFLAVLDQEHPQGWDEIYLSHTFHEVTNYYPMRAVISGQYKYILNVAYQLPFAFASDLYASNTWQGVLARKDTMYGQRKVQDYLQRPHHELYDLAADPGELHNLADNPQHAERLQALQSKLKVWQKQTADPWVHKWEYD
jgi:N-sulfoglucosamine sulfohydrolase